ncbi:hypothetical protein [Acaryochloris sp. CCMEE 5410]|uniref:hypothetical protein n=1 Tax=Acaryochloris sp. CCMEE 5410 TaxID=310037 RepID=UPI0002483B9B|nr:hypothetical protein [Acaryochloris sp. CCMEE 5410]KAI9132430.1 hypothetical protein ON05_002920 [Acaryochloris sp. CCMEE 5410]
MNLSDFLIKNTIIRKDKGAFVFVIPVRNPRDQKVVDYSCIEAVLHETVKSLVQQTYLHTHIVIVCHKIPPWSKSIGSKVTFLNVSNIPTFPPDENPVRVDKGLKYIIGILYAKHNLNPFLIMPIDADDYVNIRLARKLVNKGQFNKNLDGYILKKGLHVNLEIAPDYSVDYEAAYVVREFDRTCGSCRVFKTDALIKSIETIDSDIASKFSCWPLRSQNASVTVPAEPVVWLSNISQPHYLSENNIVNILGRHINQSAYFKLVPLNFIGAAKGCGHGNHDGPKQGKIHMDKSIGTISVQKFCSDFGILNQKDSQPVHKKVNLRFFTNGFP